jgi:hypothetical protein
LSTNQDSESCTRPKAEAICISSPSWMAPLKKRGAATMKGKTTAAWPKEAVNHTRFFCCRISAGSWPARAKAAVQVLVLHGFAPVQGDGFAVLAHAHQVVAKVGLIALLLEVQR